MASVVATVLSTQDKLLRAREAAGKLALLSTHEKNALLLTIADAVEANSESILAANREDVESSGLAGAMRDEYEAIAGAGITLQLDCPDLALSRNSVFAGATLEEFRRIAALNVEALNHAVARIPPERMRLHLCWGNYEGPHERDIPLRDIVDVVLAARPAGLVIEACNPRHGHEWRVWEDVRLPDDRYLVPGVIDSTNNYVEHPELVAQRLLSYVRIVGPERVIGGSDCGFGTFATTATVAPSIVWSKLGSLVEGARLASVAG